MGEWRSGSNLRHLPPPNMETAAGWGDCGEGGGDWGYGHLGTKGIAGRKLAKLVYALCQMTWCKLALPHQLPAWQ